MLNQYNFFDHQKAKHFLVSYIRYTGGLDHSLFHTICIIVL
jgi:hypothetical protein